MASGKTHFLSNVALSVATIPVGYVYPELIPQLVVGNLLGIFLTPDLDSPSGTYTEALISNFLAKCLTLLGRRKTKAYKDTKIINRIVVAINAPYGVLIPHRSWLSHAPVISIVTIGLYFYGLYYVVCRTLNIEIIPLESIYVNYFETLTLWAAHNVLHYFLDGGMILIFGKNVYTLTYPFYKLTTVLFPQGKGKD